MPYGSVLIVDDVETNIYVAKGLLAPYGLKIDSTESGYGAIEKIKSGKTYDTVFMDHMMPKMDGIEATKIIREMGYTRPIVALTANAVAGQADIFLGNGFDDYISKPIDVRQLNIVLNKLIRDKQTPETLEAARKIINGGQQPPGEAAGGATPQISAKFAEIFARDAAKSLAALNEISDKNDYAEENNMRNYIINVHGMKSALANIGKMDLSAAALKLEVAAREGKLDIVAAETPYFLKALQKFTEEIAPKPEPAGDVEAAAKSDTDEDRKYLSERLAALKAACEEYDKNTVNAELAAVNQKTWSQPVKELLENIAKHLLHSDFEEIADAVDKFSGKY